MSRSFDVEMQGRIIALELLVRGLLAEAVNRTDQPVEAATRMKSSMLASLQNVTRPVNDYSDQIWEAAADALRRQLDDVIHRIHSKRTKDNQS